MSCTGKGREPVEGVCVVTDSTKTGRDEWSMEEREGNWSICQLVVGKAKVTELFRGE